jgi:hypothetical protein
MAIVISLAGHYAAGRATEQRWLHDCAYAKRCGRRGAAMIYVTEGFARQFRIFGFGFLVFGQAKQIENRDPNPETRNQKPETRN